jgi:hypothetical protein
MSDYIGFLVVNQEDGFCLEGKDHAAKIFEHRSDAISACGVMSKRTVFRLRYEMAIQSLLKGSAFMFDSDEGLARFHKKLRNDMAHKPYLARSQDRTYVRWKDPAPGSGPAAGMAANAPVQTAPAGQPPVEAPAFNPAVLVREGNP